MRPSQANHQRPRFYRRFSVAVAKDGDGEGAERLRLERKRNLEAPDYEKPWDQEYDEDWDRDYEEPRYGEDEYDPALLPPPESEFDYPIEPVDPTLIMDFTIYPQMSAP